MRKLLTVEELAAVYSCVAQYMEQGQITKTLDLSATAVVKAIRDAGGKAEVARAILSGEKTAEEIAKDVASKRRKPVVRIKKSRQLDRIESMLVELNRRLAG